MKYQLAIFDLDGTLASSLDSIAECLRVSLATFNFPAPSRDEIRSTVGLTLEDSLGILTHGKASARVVAEMVKFYRELYESNDTASSIQLFEGAAHLLGELPNYGVRAALVSNKGRKALKHLLERLKIWAFFDLTLSAQDTDCNKPDPKLFTQYIVPSFSGATKQTTLVIGDSETDIQFAQGIGADCCWAAYGYGDAKRCARLKPTYKIASVSELAAILQRRS